MIDKLRNRNSEGVPYAATQVSSLVDLMDNSILDLESSLMTRLPLVVTEWTQEKWYVIGSTIGETGELRRIELSMGDIINDKGELLMNPVVNMESDPVLRFKELRIKVVKLVQLLP